MLRSLIEEWDNFRQQVLSCLNTYDLVLIPVNAYHAMPHGASIKNILGFSYTMLFNLTGAPATVIRAGTSKQGVPVGIQIGARPWREDVVLAGLHQIEKTVLGCQAPSIGLKNGS
jgi:amidase